MITLGIDLAARDRKTAACVISWGRNDAAVDTIRAHPGDGEDVGWLADLACPQDEDAPEAIGIDAPFGWPEPMREAVAAWARGGVWPAEVSKADFRFRQTDVHVRHVTRRWPLSVSSDRIAITALRCIRLLDAIAARRGPKPISRVGADGVFEVYPGAALTQWGLTRAGYKASGRAGSRAAEQHARQALLDALSQEAPWLRLGDAREAAIESDDVLDAVVAALVARAAAVGKTVWPDPKGGNLPRLAAEGWIHLPAAGTMEGLLDAMRRDPPRWISVDD